MGGKIKLGFENKIDFSDSVDIKSFEDVEYVMLSDYSKEDFEGLLQNIAEKVSGKIDIEKTLIGRIITMSSSIFDAASQTGENAREAQEQEESQVVSIFNARFTAYEGEQKGSTIKALMAAADSANGAEPDHQIEYDKDMEIDSSSTYKVSFEKDSNGYINKIIIE